MQDEDVTMTRVLPLGLLILAGSLAMLAATAGGSIFGLAAVLVLAVGILAGAIPAYVRWREDRRRSEASVETIMLGVEARSYGRF